MNKAKSSYRTALVPSGNTAILFVSFQGTEDRFEKLEYQGQHPTLIDRYQEWQLSWKWPFIWRSETVRGYWSLPKKKNIKSPKKGGTK